MYLTILKLLCANIFPEFLCTENNTSYTSDSTPLAVQYHPLCSGCCVFRKAGPDIRQDEVVASGNKL